MAALLPFHFPAATAGFALAPGEIHLWRSGLDRPAGTLQGLAQLLSPDEIRRAEAFRFPSDRAHFIAGRGLLRILLGRYLGLPPQAVRLTAGKYGKPELDGSHRAEIAFNVAHTQALALYAFAFDRRVGVDVEAFHPVTEAEGILRRFFPPRDLECYALLPAGERELRFLELWTRREAYLKGRGDGLSGPAASGDPDPGWELRSFQPTRGTVAALASEGGIKQLTAWKVPVVWAQATAPGGAG